ncbi:DNA-binding protein [uncultured Nitratireductor sp.]|uniref:DNA-binding protein n=1 Tax=uncultured Nitratireductor sp. TaxID=520953 RepID=UPI0025FC4543|nr:DNA-binding protein [uncultured Nitratireductor sp.]
MGTTTKSDEAQFKRFQEAARNLETDESEEAFDRVLKKVGSAKPAPVEKPKRPKPARKE